MKDLVADEGIALQVCFVGTVHQRKYMPLSTIVNHLPTIHPMPEEMESEARSGKCLAASLQGSLPRSIHSRCNRVWLVRDMLVASLKSLTSARRLKTENEAVASHPASRRPVGTGQLPVSGREAVPDSLLADLLTESLSKRLTTL